MEALSGCTHLTTHSSASRCRRRSNNFHIRSRLLVARHKKSCACRSEGLLRSSIASGGSGGVAVLRCGERRRREALALRTRQHIEFSCSRRTFTFSGRWSDVAIGSRFAPGAFLLLGLVTPTQGVHNWPDSLNNKATCRRDFSQCSQGCADLVASLVVQGRRNPLHTDFALRLARAREAAGMTGAGLSVAIGMHRAAASGLERGGRVPRVDTVEKLAKALGVSPCYLAYGVELPCPRHTGTRFSDMPQRLSVIRQERGLSRLELGRLSATSHTFVRMTETGTTVPNIAKVEQLAKALNVSVCWLAYGIGSAELPAGRRVRSDTPPAPDPHA